MAEISDLKRAYDALNKKRRPYKILNDYYYGDQPLKYSAERLKDAFDSPLVRFTQNWCAVVINSVLDRLVFKGWDIEDESADDIIDQFYLDSNIQKLSNDIHLNTLNTSESFIVFDTIGEKLCGFYNDSRLVQVFYNPNNPNEKTFAAKWWKDNEVTRLNLYYPDRIEKYKAEKTPSFEKAFTLETEDDNPYEEIPVIHFDLNYSELDNVIPIQDAVNKTFSDMMVVGEFNAFKQRWAVTNSDTSKLKSSPQSFFQFPKGASDEENTQIGQFDEANLDMYLDAMDKLANSIAIISRTPKHYFHDTSGNISGEALIVMESPLIKKIRQLQEVLALGWRDCARFVLKQSGKSVEPTDIITIWDPVETIQPLTKANEISAYVNLGVPLETMLRRAGWGADEIAQMKKDMKTQKEEQASVGQTVLELLKLRDAQANVTGADE